MVYSNSSMFLQFKVQVGLKRELLHIDIIGKTIRELGEL